MEDRFSSILFLLKPKASIAYLETDQTIRQALEKMKHHGYTALPVIDRKGHYAGTVSEGDFLWHILDIGVGDIHSLEKHPLSEIIRRSFNPPVRVSAHIDDLIGQIMGQNFVPVIDDQDVLMGIITRQDVIRYLNESNS
ncbi:MAG: CBS domain-containing protein [Erysipelotrichaceae bacterium]|nr:CBS domain-containing protein [Erysipelotrichaceae bacterium]